MKKLLMMIGAAAMLPFATSAAWSEDTYTTTTNGVTWTYKVDTGTGAIKLVENSGGAIVDKTASGVLYVPATIVHDGVAYNVTEYGILKECASLTGVVFPEVTFAQTGTGATFQNMTACVAVWWKGPETVTSGIQPVSVIGNKLTRIFYQDTSLRAVVFGPNVGFSGGNSSSHPMFLNCTNVRAFVPKARWNASSAMYFGSASECKVIKYGPGEDIDISIDGTFTVATSNRLDDVLSVANYLHDYCGMNPKINVTNVIEVADGMITAEKLAFLDNGTFNSLVFKVNTQAQLDTLLAAIPSSVPFAINPADSKVELTVPQGREVYVKLSAEGKNGKYTPKINGLIISFH